LWIGARQIRTADTISVKKHRHAVKLSGTTGVAGQGDGSAERRFENGQFAV
jgi:hypothetical protein